MDKVKLHHSKTEKIDECQMISGIKLVLDN